MKPLLARAVKNKNKNKNSLSKKKKKSILFKISSQHPFIYYLLPDPLGIFNVFITMLSRTIFSSELKIPKGLVLKLSSTKAVGVLLHTKRVLNFYKA